MIGDDDSCFIRWILDIGLLEPDGGGVPDEVKG
jgi:hypothetical protein